jgi:hypothetical protein
MDFCDHGNETSASIKVAELLNYLSVHQLIKYISAQCKVTERRRRIHRVSKRALQLRKSI